MSVPVAYTRKANFTTYASTHTSVPYNPADHDLEFNAIVTSLDQTQAVINGITRSDGKLKNQIVSLDSMESQVKNLIFGKYGAITLKGNWLSIAPYAFTDVVANGGGTYICLADHTSSASFSADVALGYWASIGSIDGAIVSAEAQQSADDAHASYLLAVIEKNSALAAAQASEVSRLASGVSATESEASALESATSASEALASANAASVTAGAVKWVAATYAEGDVVWSPFNFLTYRRITAGVSAVDPSSDPSAWSALASIREITTVDFGSTVPSSSLSVTIADSQAKTNKRFIASVESKVGNSSGDEMEMDSFNVSARCNADGFVTFNILCLTGVALGQYVVNYDYK